MSRFEDPESAGVLVALPRDARVAPAAGVSDGEAPAETNLYAACELIAARPSTRRRYAGTFRRFCDALRAELGARAVVAVLASA